MTPNGEAHTLPDHSASFGPSNHSVERDEVICSCQIKPHSDDDPETITRPRRVALHNATDHWRPAWQRSIRASRPKTSRLRQSHFPGKDEERSSSPSKRKLEPEDIRLNEPTSKRDSPVRTNFEGEPALLQEQEVNIKDEKCDSQEHKQWRASNPHISLGNGSTHSENTTKTSAKSNLPPSLKSGRLLPSRLLESENVSVASAIQSSTKSAVFDDFTSKPKHVYGKRGKLHQR